MPGMKVGDADEIGLENYISCTPGPATTWVPPVVPLLLFMGAAPDGASGREAPR
jgi:hypothetical protein